MVWNASKHKAMSDGRMGEAEQKLKDEIDALLQRAEAEDAAEDEKYGKGRCSGQAMYSKRAEEQKKSREGRRSRFLSVGEAQRLAVRGLAQ